MPGQHSESPLTVRPPRAVRERLAAYLKRTGRRLNKFISEAIEEKLDREEGGEA